MPLPTTNFIEVLQIIQLASRKGGVTFEEIQERVGFTPSEVLRLRDTLNLVEIPPFLPDDIIDLMVTGNRVEICCHLNLAKPLNLSSQDILALNLALKWGTQQALIDPGIAAAISHKIHSSQQHGHGFEMDGLRILVADDTPGRELLEPLSKAAQECHQTHFDYFSQHQGETTARTVAPYRLYVREGIWYLRAYEEIPSNGKAGWRTFRLDRIRNLIVREVGFNPDSLPETQQGERLFVFEDGDKILTRTRFSPATARYIREMAPSDQIQELHEGGLILKYPVAGFPYFRSFVLQFGTDALVLEPASFRDAIVDQLERLIR